MDKSLVTRATSSDDSPAPGYLLTDIARLTVANYDACLQLEEQLISRLEKNNHNVKYKVLCVIKYVCRNGRVDFKRDMAKHVEAIKACLQYRGPPDPLRGDEIYRRVRDAAREALDAIFDSQMPTTSSGMAASSRIQGFGSVMPEEPPSTTASIASAVMSGVTKVVDKVRGQDAPYTGATGSELPGVRPRMEGFGSHDPREEKSIMQKASEMVKSVRGVGAPAGTRTAFNNEYGYASNRGPAAIRPGGYSSPAAFQNPSMGVWGNPGSTGLGGGSAGAESAVVAPIGRVGGAAGDGEYEHNMIADLCAPGGTRAVPPQDKLNVLTSNIASLNPDLIGEPLLEHLDNESWQSRAKALIVIESILKAPGADAHVEWWRERAEIVAALREDVKASVRDKSVKVARLLGLVVEPAAHPTKEGTGRTAGSAAAAAANGRGGPTNLLDFDEEQAQASAAAPPAVPVAAPAAVAPAGGLFSGLDEHSSGFNLAGMSSFEPQTPSTTGVSTPSADPFMGLNVADQSHAGGFLGAATAAPPAAAPPAPMQAMAKGQGANITDIFSNMSLLDNTAPAAAAPLGGSISTPVSAAAASSSLLDDLDPLKSGGAATGAQPPHAQMGYAMPGHAAAPMPAMPMAGMPGMPGMPAMPAMPAMMTQQQMLWFQQQQMLYMQQMYAQQQGQMPGAAGMPRASAPMGMPVTGMLAPTAKRAVIPHTLDAPAPESSSGFSFLSGGGAGQKGDSFDFVQDELRRK